VGETCRKLSISWATLYTGKKQYADSFMIKGGFLSLAVTGEITFQIA
jgi:hypothetical protein